MSEVEYIANMAEIISGLAVIIGIGFGFVEYRRHKTNERREAVASLARSFQTQELAAAIRVVLELPGPIDNEQYKTLSRVGGRLCPYAEELRRELNGPQAWEWYQWLAEQIAKSHRKSPRIPAHIATKLEESPDMGLDSIS